MRKGLIASALALSASMLFSGCFIMRSLDWTNDRPEPGEKTRGLISLSPGGGSGPKMFKGVSGDPGYPFFTLTAESDLRKQGAPARQLRLANIGRFDTTGTIGGPSPMLLDNDLAAVLADGGECEFFVAGKDDSFGKGPVPGPSTVLRAEDEFPTHQFRKIVEARAPVKINNNATSPAELFLIGPGVWFDDGDGTPEPSDGGEDDYACGAPYTSTLIIKGNNIN